MVNSGFNTPGPMNDLYETPDWLFKALDTEFDFTLDPCASKETAKCSEYFTKEEDGLRTSWIDQTIFVNPPYSNIGPWIKRGLYLNAAPEYDQTTVFLLPVRPNNNWFKQIIWTEKRNEIEIRWMRKRINFLLNGVEQTAPRFASMIVIM